MIIVKTDGSSFIEISGHAGYAPAGSDIVCAAVSILYETLKELLSGQAIVDESENKCILRARHWLNSPWKIEYMEFFITGIKGIAEAYPDNVKLMIKRS